MHAIKVRDLSKFYVVPEREAGLVAALKSLVNRKMRVVKAVETISFSVEPGERSHSSSGPAWGS
jgi:ABC-2 type transport system ATP-binding protein